MLRRNEKNPGRQCNLLAAGVRIHEYEGGLLHTKSVTADGEITLIGSANMDRRSFELNYENDILFHDSTLTGAMRERQRDYIDVRCEMNRVDRILRGRRRRHLVSRGAFTQPRPEAELEGFAKRTSRASVQSAAE